MAKKNDTTSTEAGFTFSLPIDILEAAGFSTAIGRVDPKGLAYLLTYGLGKSLQDAVSGQRKALEADGKDEETIEKTLQEKMADRFDKILRGEVGSGGGRVKRKGLDAIMWDVAEEWLRAKAATKGKKLPDKAADRNPIVEAYIKAADAKIRAEAVKRLAQSAEADEADSVLADL